MKFFKKLFGKQEKSIEHFASEPTIKSITTKLKTTKAPEKPKTPAKSKKPRMHNLQKPKRKRPSHSNRAGNGPKGK